MASVLMRERREGYFAVEEVQGISLADQKGRKRREAQQQSSVLGPVGKTTYGEIRTLSVGVERPENATSLLSRLNLTRGQEMRPQAFG